MLRRQSNRGEHSLAAESQPGSQRRARGVHPGRGPVGRERHPKDGRPRDPSRAGGDDEVFRLNCKINDERSTSQTLHPKPKIKIIPMPNCVNVVLNDIQPSKLVIAISENQKGKTKKVNAALPATLSDLLIILLYY